MTNFQKNLTLGVMLLIILVTFIAAVIVGVGLVGSNARPDLLKWLIGGGVGEMLAVVLLMFQKSGRLRSPISVTLEFPLLSRDQFVELDQERSTYESYGPDDPRRRNTGKLTPVRGPGGTWRCELPAAVRPDDFIKVFADGSNGERWETDWFTMVNTTQAVSAILNASGDES